MRNRLVALQCVAVCCSVLQCVAVCCSVLQCVAVFCLYQFVRNRLVALLEALYARIERYIVCVCLLCVIVWMWLREYTLCACARGCIR